MKSISLLSLAAVVGIALCLVGADEKEAKCPISGKAVSKDQSLNVNGKTVGFCCGNCVEKYKKDLNISADKAENCPTSGKPGKAETAVIEKTAEMVHFCCANCPKGFAAKNKFTVQDDGPKNCPLSGKPASKDHSLVVNGKTIYFCCGNCPKGYLKGLGISGDVTVGNCPLSGKPGKAETAQVVVKSKEVVFCCNNCKAGYLEKNFKDGVKVSTASK